MFESIFSSNGLIIMNIKLNRFPYPKKNQLLPQFGAVWSLYTYQPSHQNIWMVKRTDSTNFKSYCAVRSLYQPDVFTAWLVGLQARRLTLNRN
jgi:hypothetical protein